MDRGSSYWCEAASGGANLRAAPCVEWETGGAAIAVGRRDVSRHVSAALIMSERMNKKKRQRDRAVVVPGDGDPCPRCGVPMQIREYSELTDKHLHRPYFYTRWFCCMNKSCRTTLVMPARYKVMNPAPP